MTIGNSFNTNKEIKLKMLHKKLRCRKVLNVWLCCGKRAREERREVSHSSAVNLAFT
jgi:hypothetical protein